MAAHYMRSVGEELVFHDRRGRAHRRTIIKRTSFNSLRKTGDIGVGLLDRPLPKTVRIYPLPEPKKDYRPLINGALALVTDQKRCLYFHRIIQAGETNLIMGYDRDLDASRNKRLISGDSGNPTFVLTNGELALLGTHSGGGPGTGPLYGSREIQSTLGEVIRQLDPDYSFRTIPIDRKVLKESAESGVGKPRPRDPEGKPVRPAGVTPPEQGNPPRKPRPRTVAPPVE
jgi:hypothetical protein